MSLLRIAIDAGHGGTDRGAVRDTFCEADYNLNLARALLVRAHSSNEPVECKLVRERNDERMSLSHRGEMTSAWRADLVISLHVNAFDGPELHGGLVFHWPGNDVGSEVGDAIARALPPPLFRDQAWSIPAVGLHDDEHRWLQRPRSVLAPHEATSVLVEVGYCSNPIDRVALEEPATQSALIVSLMAGIARFRQLMAAQAA